MSHRRSCSFEMLGRCHLKTYAKAETLRPVSNDELELLTLRSKLPVAAITDICSHHEQVLVVKYSALQRKCCNAFQLHNSQRKKSLQNITHTLRSDALKLGFSLVPGDKLCPQCRAHFVNLLSKQEATVERFEGAGSSVQPDIPPQAEDQDSPSTSVSDEISASRQVCVEDTSLVLECLGESPVKLGGLNSSQKMSRAKRKLDQASTALKRKLEESYQTSLDGVEEPVKKPRSDDIAMYQNLMENLREKFTKSTSYQEKLQILTLSPFTIEETQRFFQATNYMVKKSRKLREAKGVLSMPDKLSRGYKLSDEVKAQVVAFYESDEVSRVCPGTKDKVSVRLTNGEKVTEQKRLVLANLKEIYAEFKKCHPDIKIGFSSFAALRPRWCVLAGSSGTHSVCVCVYHQNPKLMLTTLTKKIDLTDCLKAAVCNMEREECMMNECKECPGKEGVKRLLTDLEELDFMEEITFQQWVTTDRCTLLTLTHTVDEFVEDLASKVSKLTRHHYIAHQQALYLKKLKESLVLNECIIHGDFSENYSFVVQDAAQGFHWENSQATLHPYVVYYKNAEGVLQAESHCVISDCKEHSASTVYQFQKVLLQTLKVKHPSIVKIHYFTDGCGGQYKNRYNFVNLCHHELDFGLLAEWNFFATSHGKGACDGIGGTVKRGTVRASLQRPVHDQILTPKDMFEFCSQTMHGIKFHFVSKESVLEVDRLLQTRFDNSHTIKGTRRYHRYIPQSTTSLAVHDFSLGKRKRIVHVTAHPTQEEELPDVTVGGYVACLYDDQVWFAVVVESSTEFIDHLVKFMHPTGNKKTHMYVFPAREDKCWMKEEDILCTIEPPQLKNARGQYLIPQEMHTKAMKAWDAKKGQQ